MTIVPIEVVLFFFHIFGSGETTGNRDGILHGVTDGLLTSKGREQASKCGQWLRDQKFNEAVSSPLSRARDTARLILAENRHLDSELVQS